MFAINKNGTKYKAGIIMPAFFPASRTTYDNTTSDLSATKVQGAIDEVASTVAGINDAIAPLLDTVTDIETPTSLPADAAQHPTTLYLIKES